MLLAWRIHSLPILFTIVGVIISTMIVFHDLAYANSEKTNDKWVFHIKNNSIAGLASDDSHLDLKLMHDESCFLSNTLYHYNRADENVSSTSNSHANKKLAKKTTIKKSVMLELRLALHKAQMHANNAELIKHVNAKQPEEAYLRFSIPLVASQGDKLKLNLVKGVELICQNTKSPNGQEKILAKGTYVALFYNNIVGSIKLKKHDFPKLYDQQDKLYFKYYLLSAKDQEVKIMIPTNGLQEGIEQMFTHVNKNQ